ncbi:unnamed protein product, partial [Iphiclides podalirius]
MLGRRPLDLRPLRIESRRVVLDGCADAAGGRRLRSGEGAGGAAPGTRLPPARACRPPSHLGPPSANKTQIASP